MQKIAFFFALVFTTMGCNCDAPVKSKFPPATIHAFIDIDAIKVDDGDNKNIARLMDFMHPIMDKYVNAKIINPIDCTIHPLYSRSMDRVTVFQRNITDSEIEDIGGAGRDAIVNDFNPIPDYRKFAAARMKGANQQEMTHRTIWPSMYLLADIIARSKTKNVQILYYSNMLEANAGNPEQGMYMFTIPVDPLVTNGRCMLDCSQIELAMHDLNDPQTTLGKEVATEAVRIKKALEHKTAIVKIYTPDKEDLSETQNCSSVKILENYWNAFFQALGLEVEWVDLNGLTG